MAGTAGSCLPRAPVRAVGSASRAVPAVRLVEAAMLFAKGAPVLGQLGTAQVLEHVGLARLIGAGRWACAEQPIADRGVEVGRCGSCGDMGSLVAAKHPEGGAAGGAAGAGVRL